VGILVHQVQADILVLVVPQVLQVQADILVQAVIQALQEQAVIQELQE
jgi:hypothetical protein